MQKKDSDAVQCPWGTLAASSDPSPATVATTIQSTQLSCAVTSPPLLSNPYPQQDILRLAGIQCQYSLRPQPVVQTWKLHHWGKMVLFQWKSTTISKHSSSETHNSGPGGIFALVKNNGKVSWVGMRLNIKCHRMEEVAELCMNKYLIGCWGAPSECDDTEMHYKLY